jgi:hypothetical protein
VTQLIEVVMQRAAPAATSYSDIHTRRTCLLLVVFQLAVVGTVLLNGGGWDKFGIGGGVVKSALAVSKRVKDGSCCCW